MLNYSNIDLKVCGITTSQSILTAANNSIRSLGFSSKNLLGPNTCNDELIKNLIEECDYYKIESVLLSRYQTTLELIKQIDYTKPKTIACSKFIDKTNLNTIKKEIRNCGYKTPISHLVNEFYYDLNVYGKKRIKTFSIHDCKNQIRSLKTLNKPIYVGGGIDHKNAKLIIKNTDPQGLDISRSLKDSNNNLCEEKLNKLLKILAADVSL